VTTNIYSEKRKLLITTIRYIKRLRLKNFNRTSRGLWALYDLHPSSQFHGSNAMYYILFFCTRVLSFDEKYCNSPIFVRFILINFYVCLYVLVCD